MVKEKELTVTLSHGAVVLAEGAGNLEVVRLEVSSGLESP